MDVMRALLNAGASPSEAVVNQAVKHHKDPNVLAPIENLLSKYKARPVCAVEPPGYEVSAEQIQRILALTGNAT